MNETLQQILIVATASVIASLIVKKIEKELLTNAR